MNAHKISTRILFALLFVAIYSTAQTLPYHFVNNSTYADKDIYIAVLGITNEWVWIDPRTGLQNPIDSADNTVAGPVINGNRGPGGKGLYANCFAPLSSISSGIIAIPQIASSRILISFGSPLYLYFFGAPGTGTFAAPNLANPTDPNQGIRFESIELTYNSGGLYTNTTRVDAYQYPMGLEVWGINGFDQKTGEIQTHQAILADWKSSVSATFQGCLDTTLGIIHNPSKTAAFMAGGAQGNYFKAYVDSVWNKYSNEDLIFNSGSAGIWKGRVQNEQFVFHNLTNMSGTATAYITRRPTTQEVLDGSGVLAQDVQKIPGQGLDQVVQAQVCAAFNRHAINLSTPTGSTQEWLDSSNYFKAYPYNEYVKFWHRADISYQQSSYGFCYDDVGDYSSTIKLSSPTRATVTIGGFYTPVTPPTATICRNPKAVRTSLQNRLFDLNGRRVQ